MIRLEINRDFKNIEEATEGLQKVMDDLEDGVWEGEGWTCDGMEEE